MSGFSGDVVVVGGGIVGCMTAYYLSRAGFGDLRLLERDGIASGASGYSAGILTPYSGSNDGDLLALSRWALSLHAELADELPGITGVDHGYDLAPYLRCAFGERGYDEARSFMSNRLTEGHDAEWLSGDEARGVCDWLSDDVEGACATEIEPTVDSGLLTRSAFEAAMVGGARLVTGEATGLVKSGDGRASGVLVRDGSLLEGDAFVLSMGPWAMEAEEWLGFSVPVKPQKGQLLYMHEADGRGLDGDKPSAGLHNMDDGGVILPRRISRTVLGATKEDAGFDREPSDHAWDFILPRVSRLSSRVSEASVTAHTACLRPMPLDGRPYVGLAPGWENVYVATGHWSEGVHYGPLTGKWLADSITGAGSEYDLSALAVGR